MDAEREATAEQHDATNGRPLGEVVGLFLKLGVIGFGGPTAHIALMEEEAVRRRGWVSRDVFLDALAVTNMVPGPNSTELAIHLSYLRAGRLGGLLGGLAFILPAFVLILALSWAYFALGSVPQVAALFAGVKPAVIALILAAGLRLGRPLLGRPFQLAMLLFGFVATLLLPEWELFVLLLAGLAGLARGWRPSGPAALAPLLLAALPAAQAPSTALPTLAALGWVFLKAGALLFGGGYVLIPLVEPEVVGVYGWLDHGRFLDGVALGQATPGPITLTATFVGYAAAGLPGAVVATVAVFLPAFLIVLFGTGPYLERLRAFRPARDFLTGVTGAVVGAILATGVSLGRPVVADPFGVAVLLAALVALVRFRADTLLVIAGAALLGLGRMAVG